MGARNKPKSGKGENKMIADLFFYLFSSLILLGVTGVIVLRNPVHGALSLIFTFLNAAGLLLLLYNEFLAMIVVIVYVGAVATLFLFVIMMLRVKSREAPNYSYSLACVGVSISAFFFVFYKGGFEYMPMDSVKEIPLKTMALSMYVDYADYLQLMGLLLLLAMVGCIVLVEAIRAQSGTFVKRQNMGDQTGRSVKDSVILVPKRNNDG